MLRNTVGWDSTAVGWECSAWWGQPSDGTGRLALCSAVLPWIIVADFKHCFIPSQFQETQIEKPEMKRIASSALLLNVCAALSN